MSRRSVALAALSTVVEWYDFTLYLYFATILSRIFFGGGSTALGQTLASFALAYLLRPLGAIAFGHIGDRHGRRLTMLLSMGMMAAAMPMGGQNRGEGTLLGLGALGGLGAIISGDD